MSRAHVAFRTPGRSRATSRPILRRACACGAHTPGGGSCTSCGREAPPARGRYIVAPSDDAAEAEARRIAGAIGSCPGAAQTAASQGAAKATSKPARAPISVDRALHGSWRPLPQGLRDDMGMRFGRDFSDVRVHDDEKAHRAARDIHAKAFANGNDIIFGKGNFAPSSDAGRALVAHELTHVAQSSAGQTSVRRDIDQAALDQCVAELGGTTGYRDGGLPSPEELDAYRAECSRRQKDQRDAARTSHFISDIISSVADSPRYFVEFFSGDLRSQIEANIGRIVAVTLALLAVQSFIVELSAAPTGVTQVMAAILEALVVAFLASTAAVELASVVQYAELWWMAARDAGGTASGIATASRAFVRMVWHITMLVMAVAGVRARFRPGGTTPIRPPSETPPRTPPGLRLIQGGNTRPVQIRGGRVVSSRPRAASGGRDGPVASRGGAQPARSLAEPAEAPVAEPLLEAVPESAVGPAATTGPSAPTTPGVQPLPAAAAGLASPPRRRDPTAYPLYWPSVFGPPALFDAPIVFFQRTPQAERDLDYGVQLRRELWARHRHQDPDLFPPALHAHHIVPLFLGGMEGARGNIMFLPAQTHRNGHVQLQNQPQMQTPPPPLTPLPANILNPAHLGIRYELVGFK